MKFYLTGLGNLYANKNSIINGIIEADSLGFDGALMPDHYMWGDQIGHSMPNPYSTLETWTTLTYIAGKTENIHLGTLVTPIPFRHPGMLAKMLSSLDVLSGGRVVLGVGAGWSTVEFEGYSEWGEAKYRVDKTIEGLKLIIKLWTEKEVTMEGNFYKVKGAVLEPKPIQKPYPKLLFGSTGKRMLKLTGKYGDICFIPPWAGEKTFEYKKEVLKSAEKHGRKDKIAFMKGMMGARGSFDIKMYSNMVENAIQSGATYINTAFPRDTMIQSMRKFSKDIIPSYK